jgi:hypothetical protein
MGGIGGAEVIDLWERLNLVELRAYHREALVNHPDTHALAHLPSALVVEAAYLARQDNHYGQLRLGEWRNRAVSLAADAPAGTTSTNAGPARVGGAGVFRW